MADKKFVCCTIRPPVASSNSGKSSNDGHLSSLNHLDEQHAHSMHNSQNSSAFRSVQCAMTRASMLRVLRNAFDITDTRWWEALAEASIHVTASALLTKCNSLPPPRFSPTCGSKYATDLVNGLTEQHQQSLIRRMAPGNPSQTARNFKAPAQGGQPSRSSLTSKPTIISLRRARIDHDYLED